MRESSLRRARQVWSRLFCRQADLLIGLRQRGRVARGDERRIAHRTLPGWPKLPRPHPEPRTALGTVDGQEQPLGRGAEQRAGCHGRPPAEAALERHLVVRRLPARHLPQALSHNLRRRTALPHCREPQHYGSR